MVEWIAFTKSGDRLFSKSLSFNDLKLEDIGSFAVLGSKSTMYVNLLNRKMCIDGNEVESIYLDSHRVRSIENNEELKLVYFHRACSDFSNSVMVAHRVLYVALGWETESVRVFMKMMLPSEEVEIDIVEKV